jgi:hypothetical protein
MASNPTGMEYLSGLLQQANTLRQEQENRQRKLVSDYETKVRRSNISERSRQASLSESSSRTLTPKKRNLIEPNTTYTKEAVSGMGQLYQQAQAYNPFATTKTQSQLYAPVSYFETQSSNVNKSITENKLNFATQLENIDKAEKAFVSSLRQKYGMPEGKRGSRAQEQAFVREYYRQAQGFAAQKQGIQNQLNRYNEAANVIGGHTKTLNDYSNELKKYYGQNFENISKEQLAVADMKSFQNLTAEMEKYTSLRDSYIKKYQTSGSKVDMDWIKQYNDLMNDTAKSISSELPKIFTAAGKQVSTIQKTQQSTLDALGKLNQVFGERGQGDVKQTLEQRQRKVEDVTSVSRDQALARLQRLSSSGAMGAKSKPAPKYESRPT